MKDQLKINNKDKKVKEDYIHICIKKIKEETTGIRDNFEFARNKRTFLEEEKKKRQIESSRTEKNNKNKREKGKRERKKRSKPFFEALAMLHSFISIEVLKKGRKS